ncbi:type II secretion system protein [Lentilactobacillus otakiensis]|uniref:type II secretion system protein n=1 Tax=Lentilactobacillus otakiensis TaxID=481720 RepID=UPI003D18676F
MSSGSKCQAFTAVDSLIGLTIICTFSLFYIQTIHQMNTTIAANEQIMISERQRYEATIADE